MGFPRTSERAQADSRVQRVRESDPCRGLEGGRCPKGGMNSFKVLVSGA